MSSPALPLLLGRDWTLQPGLDCVLGGTAVAYLGGVVRVRGRWPIRCTASFLGGLLALIIALQSGLDAYDDRLLSVHMVQHLFMLTLAPLLLLAGKPAILALRGLPRPQRRPFSALIRRAGDRLRPLPCLALYSTVVLLVHLPPFFNAAVRHPVVHELEHLLLVLAGLLLWWPVLDGDPLISRRLGGLGRIGYVMAAMVPMSVIGAWLAHDAGLAYVVYRAPALALHVSAVGDQQTAGGIMWVAGSLVMVTAGLWLAMSALLADERRQTAIDLGTAQTPRLLAPHAEGTS